MFSGIIADLGVIVDRSPRGNGCTLLIETGFPIGGEDGIQLGDSIACNGVCLTAESLQPPHRFTVAAGKETLDCTTFGSLKAGDRLHMERALQVNARLDGHIVKPRPGWQHAGGLQICENAVKPGFKLGKQVHRARL